MQRNGGFIQVIIIIVLLIVIISLLGISLKEIFDRLSANQEVKDNFVFIKNWMIDVYNKYLSGPMKDILIWAKNFILDISKPIIPGK